MSIACSRWSSRRGWKSWMYRTCWSQSKTKEIGWRKNSSVISNFIKFHSYVAPLLSSRKAFCCWNFHSAQFHNQTNKTVEVARKEQCKNRTLPSHLQSIPLFKNLHLKAPWLKEMILATQSQTIRLWIPVFSFLLMMTIAQMFTTRVTTEKGMLAMR